MKGEALGGLDRQALGIPEKNTTNGVNVTAGGPGHETGEIGAAHLLTTERKKETM